MRELKILPDQGDEWIEGISPDIHIIISDESFASIYELRFGTSTVTRTSWILEHKDEFSENPTSVIEGTKLNRVVIKGILSLDQGLHFLYIYKNTGYLEKECSRLVLGLLCFSL